MAYLISESKLNEIANALGKLGVQLLRDHINKQTGVSGERFPDLSPATIKAKEKKGGGIAANARLRMKATNDFVKNAFTYIIQGNEIIFSFSERPHLFKRSEAAQSYIKKQQSQNKSVSTKSTKAAEYKKQTHKNIAEWQLSGEYDQGKRKGNNPGADFLGFSNSDEKKLEYTFVTKTLPEIQKNIFDLLNSNIK